MSTKISKQQKQEAYEQLKGMLRPGDTVYTVLRHVARSGMSRSIDLFVMSDGSPRNISYLFAHAHGEHIDERNGGVKAGGCGMDMGFSLVYRLSAMLYPQGFECIGKGTNGHWGDGCPSNDHSNGDRDYTPHMHTSGGYALRHKWM